jgi:hypothetical protein
VRVLEDERPIRVLLETIPPGDAPAGSEPLVRSRVDTFYQTDPGDILRSRRIKPFVIAGTTAEGVV